MFNISFQRVGGIRFLKIGRITLSFCVTSRENYAYKQQQRAWNEARKQYVRVERLAYEALTTAMKEV